MDVSRQMHKIASHSVLHCSLECIDPVDPDSHPAGALRNVVTGAVAPQDVNIDRAVTLGQEQMEALEFSWPEGFYNTIKRQVRSLRFLVTGRLLKLVTSLLLIRRPFMPK